MPRPARRKYPYRTHARQEHRGHSGAEPRARDYLAAREHRIAGVRRIEIEAHTRDGQGHQRPSRCSRPGGHAPSADCGIHRHRQERLYQRHDYVHPVQGYARSGAPCAGRPQASRTRNYEGIPHLYTPIITEPKLAANALRNAVREMERRLKLLAAKGVRNIDQYNKLFDQDTPSLFEDAEEEKPIPYLVIIIDELADLMMLDSSNVEESITRLAQMARAVGIHLVLATQRPSVDVITGLIKANFPARISFRVATKVDSRTILDA